MAEPRIACIDIGNTRLHCGVVSGRAVTDNLHLPTNSFEEELTDWLSDKGLDGAAYCSVVPAKSPLLADLLGKLNRPVHHLTCDHAPGLPIAYPKPAEIGQDRLANAIAAQALVGTPSIVLDAGTAVTFDLITPQKGYIGGLIAPGLGMLTDYLHEKTAQLPKVALGDLHRNHPFGHSTAESMAIACAVGFGGMITALTDRALQELRDRGHSTPNLLATGGSISHLIDNAHDWQHVPNLTLLGLAEAWQRATAG